MLEDKTLAYWNAALTENIQLKELVDKLPASEQKLFENQTELTLDLSVSFEKMMMEDGSSELDDWAKENSFALTFSFPDSEVPRWTTRVSFERSAFKLYSEKLLTVFVENKEYRRRILKDTGTDLKTFLKQAFEKRDEFGIAESEESRFDELVEEGKESVNEILTHYPEVLEHLTQAFKQECVRRTQEKLDVTGLEMRPLNIR